MYITSRKIKVIYKENAVVDSILFLTLWERFVYHNIFVCFTQKSIVANGWKIILHLMDLWTDAYQNIVGMELLIFGLNFAAQCLEWERFDFYFFLSFPCPYNFSVLSCLDSCCSNLFKNSGFPVGGELGHKCPNSKLYWLPTKCHVKKDEHISSSSTFQVRITNRKSSKIQQPGNHIEFI